MLISSHFPINNLRRGLQHVDFPFILAHLWPRKPYQEILLEFQNTFAIVDNSVHERGEPIPPDKVASILNMGGAWRGILPDYIHKPIRSWGSTIRHMQLRGIDLKHWGVVLHGSNPYHIQFQHELAVELGVGVICFPYKSPRWTYLDPRLIKFQYDQHYHLMGLSEQDHLEEYAILPGKWSIDTTKLWKVDLTQTGWHGARGDHIYDSVDWGLVKTNMAYLRERFYARTTGRVPSGVEE